MVRQCVFAVLFLAVGAAGPVATVRPAHGSESTRAVEEALDELLYMMHREQRLGETSMLELEFDDPLYCSYVVLYEGRKAREQKIVAFDGGAAALGIMSPEDVKRADAAAVGMLINCRETGESGRWLWPSAREQDGQRVATTLGTARMFCELCWADIDVPASELEPFFRKDPYTGFGGISVFDVYRRYNLQIKSLPRVKMFSPEKFFSPEKAEKHRRVPPVSGDQ